MSSNSPARKNTGLNQDAFTSHSTNAQMFYAQGSMKKLPVTTTSIKTAVTRQRAEQSIQDEEFPGTPKMQMTSQPPSPSERQQGPETRSHKKSRLLNYEVTPADMYRDAKRKIMFDTQSKESESKGSPRPKKASSSQNSTRKTKLANEVNRSEESFDDILEEEAKPEQTNGQWYQDVTTWTKAQKEGLMGFLFLWAPWMMLSFAARCFWFLLVMAVRLLHWGVLYASRSELPAEKVAIKRPEFGGEHYTPRKAVATAYKKASEVNKPSIAEWFRRILYTCLALLLLWFMYAAYQQVQPWLPSRAQPIKPFPYSKNGEVQTELLRTQKYCENMHKSAQQKLDEMQSSVKKIQSDSQLKEKTASQEHNKMYERLQKLEAETKEYKSSATSQGKMSRDNSSVTEHQMQQIITQAINRYAADGLGVTDFALYSGGARVIEKETSPPYRSSCNPLLAWTLGSSACTSKPPQLALNPDINLGNCWAFAGDSGVLSIDLQRSIAPTHVSIDHIPRMLAINTSTAPRHIEVFGINALAQEVKLIDLEYNVKGDSVQTFKLPQVHPPFRHVRYKFLSNWGNSKYTCVYRVRLHGNEHTITNNKSMDE